MSDQRFIDEDQLEGRTVAKVYEDDLRIYLSFTDGTWTAIEADHGWYVGDSASVCFGEPNPEYPKTQHALKALGIPKENTDGSC